jgi:methionyl-tRNA formyltransferase
MAAGAVESPTRTIFFGSPDFAARILRRLAAEPEVELAGVFTQPDRPGGRGKKPRPPAVKTLSSDLGIPVHQPETLKDDSTLRLIEEIGPDILAVAAYGLILPRKVLQMPRLDALNVHASLLPKLRGSAPIQRALLSGERVTGVTIMRMEPGLDTGPILLQRALAVGIDDTAGSLHDELAGMGGELLAEAVRKIRRNELVAVDQDEERASYAPKVDKEEGFIDWNQPAEAVHNRIRAVTPWPGAFFVWHRTDGKQFRLRLQPGRIGADLQPGTEPGSILGLQEEGLAFACRDKAYLVPSLKPESGKDLQAADFYRGYVKR